jgi:hypothetical protein
MLPFWDLHVPLDVFFARLLHPNLPFLPLLLNTTLPPLAAFVIV